MAWAVTTVEVRSRLARACGRACFALWPIVGRARANRWACVTLYRLARYRFGNGPWQRFDWRSICAPLYGRVP